MKIMIFIPHLGKGGAENLIVNLSKELSTQAEVCLLAIFNVRESEEHLRQLESSRVSVKYLYQTPINYLSLRRRIINFLSYLLIPLVAARVWFILSKGNYQILHVNLTLPSFSLLFIRFYRKLFSSEVKLLATFHSNTHLIRGVSKWLNIASWRACDHLVTEIFEKDISKVRSYSPNTPVSHIPFGYSSDNDQSHPNTIVKGNVLKICTVSRMRVFEKKIDVMLDVVKALVDRGNDISFKLCGDGEDYSVIEAKIRSSNLEEHCEMVGFVDKAWEVYSESNLAFLATVEGESGVSGMVALDAGCLLVGIESTSAENSQNKLNPNVGEIFFSSQIEKLADFCEKLIQEPDFFEMYKVQCIHRSEHNSSNASLFTARYRALYGKLLYES